MTIQNNLYENLATEPKQDVVITAVGEVSATPTVNTILGRLKDVHDKLTELDTAFDARDLGTETTLAAFKAEQKTESDATQTLLQNELDDLQSRVGEVSATPTVNTLADRLKNIYEAVDGLELSVDNIDLDMESVELKLEELKTLVSTFNTGFDARDLGTETTLAAFKAEQKSESDATQALLQTEFDATQTAITNFDTDQQTRIGEVSTTPTANTLLDRLKQIKDQLEGNDTGSDAKFDLVITELQDIEADVEAFKTAFDARDLGTETTLSAFKAEAKSESDATQVLLQVELDDLQDRVGEISATPTANTLADRLKQIYEAVDGLELSVGNIDLDMEEVEAGLTTVNNSVQSLKTDFNAEDFSSETTLVSVLSALQAQNAAAGNSLATSLVKVGFSETQEVRIDEGLLITYHGRATDGTLTSVADWEVVRFYKTTPTSEVRIQYRTGVVWDNRATGWS